jgi:transglutaminase-like putative cysteine protease
MVISFLTITNIIAQKSTELKTKFGKLTAEEMKMSVYDKDPEANAVILFDKASLDYDINPSGLFYCKFTRHVRLKIFKKEGYEQADIQIPYSDKLKISSIRANCHNLEGEKWVASKMSSESVFDERLNKYSKVQKFTIPQVREGSIIEYEYTILDNDGGYMPSVWAFQAEIPTIWSEYEVYIPQVFDYIAMPQGNFPFVVREDAKEYTRGLYHTTAVEWETRHQRWVQKDLPALKTEPMVASLKDYTARLIFQYKGFYQMEFHSFAGAIQLRAGLFRPMANTWARLADELMKDEDFGAILTHKATLETAKLIIDTLKSDRAKVAAIYDYIGKNYQAESYKALTLRQPLKELLKQHKGAVTELNLLAINLLRHAGVEAHPVIISTRANGQLNPFYPMTERVNRVIIYLPTLDNEPFFMDMAAHPMPLGLLPIEDLNGEGFVIKDKTYKWMMVQNKVSTKSLFFNNLIINENGALSGTIEMTSTGYNALKARTQMDKDGAEKYVNILLKDALVDGKLEEHRFENTEPSNEKPLKGQFKIKTNAYVTKTDSQMYISPLLFWAEKENLFKNPERKLDVDFAYIWENIYILNLKIPEGYKVETMPQSIKINPADNSFVFLYTTELIDKQLKINVKWAIKKTFFRAAEYPILRTGYETILNKMAEQIVLSKLKQ